ncbi:NAD(P)/FAD-dependent oxidoreductase [Glaciecola siphonariae]|uniref:NAD(P)/FAD-dependent oxidoreductase n=1 Tax=Glaciecola siphonariae TaxID=521012 RepID=A0ABV9LZ30_9ALTE
MKSIHTDIVILGGGLAGMSLALQLRNKNPEFDIVVIEKNTFPVPDTTAKVGESTVEIGSHYFTEVLGLKAHFESKHLKKHGLRCFFGGGAGDYSDCDELGVSQLFGIPTYQIERGVLENHLYECLVDKGIQILDGSTPGDISLSGDGHQISCSKGDEDIDVQARWIVDAAGRQALLKNKLNLHASTGHRGNAVFFRVSDTIIIDEWSEDPQWQQRVSNPGKRWLSTNHLMGPGYWVWIIPLGSGATSFGIVLDDDALADSGISCFEDTMQWLRKEQPRCAEALEGTELLDFKVINDYSYSSKRIFSADRWALTGEAGVFPDPFYSPGSDFIAINNTFITALIEKDMAGANIQLDAAVYQKISSSFFSNTLSLYKHQYGGFGDRKMMSIKLVWDYTYYWGVLTLLFFTDTITDIDKMRALNPSLLKAQALNEKMQMLLNKRAQQRLVLPAKGIFMDQYLVPCLNQLNDVLKQKNIDVENALNANITLMENIIPLFEDMLTDSPSTKVSEQEMLLLGNYRHSVIA